MKKVGIWMYENDNGIIPKTELISRLSKKYEVISNFDMRKCYIKNGSIFTEDGRSLDDLDVLYHMNADEQSSHQRMILKFLEYKNVKIINGYNAFMTARNKCLTNFILKNNGINVPDSILINANEKTEIIDVWFKEHPISLIKPLSNHGGKGIIKVNSLEEFLDLKMILDCYFESYYFEEFLDFGENDYRIEVFNEEIIGGYSRKKAKHSFKTNITSGGIMLEKKIKEEHKKIALECCKLLNLNSTIVDIVEKNGIPYVLEVNPIMGIFIEAALKEGKKHEILSNIPTSFKTDKKKIELLVKYIDEICR